MSGITGYINNTEKYSATLLDNMSKLMRFTARDCVDKWSDDFLALSRVHHGVINFEPQPIFNEEKSLFIVMEGEVFDYKKQKLKLIHNGHKFKFENNDAEYCLHLYEEMGKGAFQGLNGSFCIIIYNLITQEILLVNDRLSSRPMFYCLTNRSRLLFSTQLSTILQSPEVPRELNLKSIFEFFTFQKVLGTETFYKDINMLPPATVLYYRKGNISFDSYWKMKYKKEKHPEEYYVNKLADAIKKSVKRRTQGDYRLGLLLSGGLDSRTILASSNKKMVCFTVGDFENREVKTAKKIAIARGCKHIFLKRDIDHYPNLINQAIEIGGDMYRFDHAHYIGFFKRIKNECDVLLHGLAFGTLCKGWCIPTKEIKLFGKNITTFFLENVGGTSTQITNIILSKSLYQKKVFQLFVEPYSSRLGCSVTKSLNELLVDMKENNARNFNREFDYFLFPSATSIPDYLHATHNRSYIDERTVAFDNDLLDAFLEIPIKLRMGAKIFKKVMRKIDPKIAAIINANTNLPTATPMWLEWTIMMAKSIFRKIVPDKKHSSINPTYTQESWPNFAELLRGNEKLKKIIGNTIKDPECLNPSIFNIPKIKEMLKEHLIGKNDYTDFLFLLLTFGKWHKKYGPNKLIEESKK